MLKLNITLCLFVLVVETRDSSSDGSGVCENNIELFKNSRVCEICVKGCHHDDEEKCFNPPPKHALKLSAQKLLGRK